MIALLVAMVTILMRCSQRMTCYDDDHGDNACTADDDDDRHQHRHLHRHSHQPPHQL